MQKYLAGIATLGLICFMGLSVWSQPQDGKGGPGKDGGKDFKKGPGGDKKGPPMGFELGKVLPPHIADTLELSEEQLKQIAALEKDVKVKLTKILTAGQVKKAEASKGLGKMDGKEGKGKEGKDKEGKGDKGKDGAAPDKKSSQPRPAMDSKLQKPAQIQWYASLDGGLKEAQRTGFPILLLSAAPHCAGVSGTW
ncbi:MAG: hypothetical protein DWH70_13710 [Planctomycetota bacterium]|nr:MAG: hypothetical protein DWH70_13710 [Planctomycetota bacterium]